MTWRVIVKDVHRARITDDSLVLSISVTRYCHIALQCGFQKREGGGGLACFLRVSYANGLLSFRCPRL